MARKTPILLICFAFVAAGFPAMAAKPAKSARTKKTAPGKATAPKLTVPKATPAKMTADQQALHALSRLTFGARPGDLEALRKQGLERWLEQQLHPAELPENPALDARLAPLDSLRMSTAEMVGHYPTPQMVKAMLDGKQAFPDDPETRYRVQKLVARYQRREAADKAGDASDSDLSSKTTPDAWKLVENGKPEEQVAALAALPADEQYAVLDSLPNGKRQRLYPLAPNDLRRRIQVFNGPVQVINQDLTEAKLYRAIYSNRQLEEVLTDFWYNHFNVFLDKGADRYMVTAYERDVIRPNVLGHFKDLLLATAQSPAMLFYLDNWQSAGPDPRPNGRRRQGLNENYGRELLELHTMGVDGGYTQQDVTEVARCFTGWSIREPQQGGSFEFNERLHDKGEKHVLGVTIPAGGGIDDGMKVLELLAHHPATAHFISKTLAMRFVADDPPETMVAKMARAFTATDGDLREVMRVMLAADEFWDPANFRSKVKSPLEMVASAVRAVGGEVDYAFALANTMNQLGEPLYRKLEPTGYPNDSSAWLNSATLVARMNFAMGLASGKYPGIKVDTTQFALDASKVEHGILMTEASASAQASIQAGLNQQPLGAMAAGLTLGSPDFQRK